MWRSSLARVLLWFVALAGLGAYALAQGESTGNIFGRVVDEQLSPIPGATITLTGPHAPRTTVTDTNGNFRLIKVPPGKYKLTVTMPGFTSFDQENVTVSLGNNTEVGAQLRLSNVQETITVTSATPLIDTRKVETGATFSSEELHDIPTARDIYALMQQVPGIQLDTVNVAGNASAPAGGPAFNSKGSAGGTYQVDGATITDNSYGSFNGGQARQSGGTNTFFDYETFQEVEVTTSGSLLDLQQPGVSINVVTKRGTNEIKGSARFYYASENWQATNTPQEAIDQGFETSSTDFIREYGAEAGGPIWKDKIWLWGAGSRQDINLNGIGVDSEGNRIKSATELVSWNAKLNAQLASSNSLSLFFQYSDRNESGIGADPYRPPETTTTLSVPTEFYKVEDNQVFGPDLFASIFASYQYPVYTDIPAGGLDQQASCPIQFEAGDCIWQGSYYFYIAKNPQYQANAQVSKFFNTGKVNHELKASFNYRKQVNDSLTGWPGDQIFGYSYSAAIVRNARPIYKQEYTSVTLGDTFTLGNLTVNAGVRYDHQTGRNLPSNAAGNPVFPELLPPINYSGDPNNIIDMNDWQPRVSASYALGENKTTLLRASYARYADQLGFMTWRLNGLPITNGYYYYWNDANGNGYVEPDEIDFNYFYGYYNNDPTAIPPNQISTDFVTPKTDEISIGFDQQIFEDFAISATYTYRRVKDLQYTLPIGADASTWYLYGNVEGDATAANGFNIPFDVPFYFLTLSYSPGQFFFNRPGATQTFNGVEFSAVKRLSNKWMLRASAAWNNPRQQIPPEAILNPNNLYSQRGPNIDGELLVGYSEKDSTSIQSQWQFNVTGMYQFPWGINLAANFFGRQGFPMAYYIRGFRDIDGVRVNNMIGQVDDYRLDNVYQLDLRLEKTFQIGPVATTLMADVFNVTNNGTVLSRIGRVGSFDSDEPGNFNQYDFFNDIQETQSPAILRLGARISF